MRLWLSIVIATLIATFPLVALADGATPGEDEIRLKDGGMLRGTIVSVEPGKEATIIVKGNEKTIPWGNIEKVEQGKYKVDEEEEDPRQPKKVKKSKKDQDDEMTEPARGAPLIHIEGTYPDIQLSKIEQVMSFVSSRGTTATGIATRSVCVAPCDQIVNGRDGAQFLFTAPGMVPSSPFSLTQYNGGIEARIDGGSVGKRFGGYMLTGLGLAGVVVGPVFLKLESGSSEILDEKPNYTPGIVMLAAGVAALAGGIVLIATSRTTFEIRPRDSNSAGIRIENGVLRF